MPFAYVAAAAAVGGAVMQYKAGQDAKEASEEQAYKEMMKMRINLIRQEREGEMVIGAQEAATAGAGFSFSGTALDLLKSSVSNASLDSALIAAGGQADVDALRAQGKAAAAQGTAGAIGGIGQAAGIIYGKVQNDRPPPPPPK
jgi:hypothetical protein